MLSENFPVDPGQHAHSPLILNYLNLKDVPVSPQFRTAVAMPNTLHPSIISRLDPEYAAFHNEHLVHLPQVHELPWDPSIRNTSHVPGSSTPLPVGRVEDYHLSRCKVRVFTPEGSKPKRGWPVFIFFHGGKSLFMFLSQYESFSYRSGGWTLGNINSETAFCTNMCKGMSSLFPMVEC